MCQRLHQEVKEKENMVKMIDCQMRMGGNWRVESIKDDHDKTQYYSGFCSYRDFEAFFKSLEYAASSVKYWSKRDTAFSDSITSRHRCLAPMDEFFLTMVCLRLGLEITDLGYRFGLSPSTVHDIFTTWIYFLYCHLNEIDWWLPRDAIQRTMPASFKAAFPKVTCIIDATELFTERPSDRGHQASFFSSYKHHHTVKALLAVSPAGLVMFVSQLYSGGISDKEITKKSGLLKKLVMGDQVMADKGFTIVNFLMDVGASLVLPPFLKTGSQFSEKEVSMCRQVASLRIDVERVIRRIKTYGILQGVTSMSSINLFDKVFTVCSYLTNFLPALVH